jgi:hypothetical protein
LPSSHVPFATAAALTVASTIANGNPNLNFEVVMSLLLYPASGSAARRQYNDSRRMRAYCGRCARYFTRNRQGNESALETKPPEHSSSPDEEADRARGNIQTEDLYCRSASSGWR